MPILVKDFSWRQSDNMIIIRVPLKGIHPTKADVFTFENYIKVHYHPFLLEVFLFSTVKDGESKCTKTEEEVVFELVKMESGLWDQLEADLGRAEKQQLREQAIAQVQERVKQERETRVVKKQELKRLAIREQMSLNNKTHKQIEDIKKTARDEAMEGVRQWTSSLEGGTRETKPNTEKVNAKVDTEQLKAKADKEQVVEVKEIFSASGNCPKDPPPIPFPRKQGSISIKFTPRMFPTPQRESRSAEEEEWLEKQAEARRSAGFVAEDLTLEEQNPVWLKDKGDSFFKLGNFLGAISAYSHAITMGSKLPALFCNRAAAHLAQGNLYRTLEDTSTALDLLVPRVLLNAKSRFRCLVRRGTALCRLNMMRQGLGEFQAALDLEPQNMLLKADIARVTALCEAGNELGADTIQINIEELD